MPESEVHARKSIHVRATPQREQSDQDELLPDNSQDLMTSQSGSDVEECEEIIVSTRRFTTQEQLITSRRVSRTPRRSKFDSIKTSPTYKSTHGSKKTSLKFFSVIVAFFLIYTYFQKKSPEDKICTFESLKERYPTEDRKLWNCLRVGIESILNKRTEKPVVYLLAHYGGQQPLQLIKDLAGLSSKCFGSTMIQIDSDFITADDTLKDYGYAITKYSNMINEGVNVVLIANLNAIPAEAAKALHFICDTHAPIAKNVVIYLTLTVQANKKGNANAIAEETLIELWGSKLNHNELGALITRVTDQVIILKTNADKFIN